eukprot:scaffold319432_cov26-Tisochrysis_lutea.AAC.1
MGFSRNWLYAIFRVEARGWPISVNTNACLAGCALLDGHLQRMHTRLSGHAMLPPCLCMLTRTMRSCVLRCMGTEQQGDSSARFPGQPKFAKKVHDARTPPHPLLSALTAVFVQRAAGGGAA